MKSDYHYWLHGFLLALIIAGFAYAIISLFTFLWWTGCIILFIYLWAGITLYLYDAEKQKQDD